MTHGVGSFGGGGGGGGGGFSGGSFAFNTTHVYTSNSQRRRRRNGEQGGGNDECNCGCCIALYSLIFFLLCLVKMKRNTRLGLLWFYVVGFSLLAGVLFSRQYSRTDTISITPGDMRHVEVRSSVLNENLVLDSTGALSVYTLEHQPNILPEPTRFYQKSFDTRIQSDSYEYWGFYLLKGSKVRSAIRGQFGMSFYVIKGKENLDTFIGNEYCDDCYLQKVYINSMENPTLSTDIVDTDQYYFLFANTFMMSSGSASVHFHVNRTLYDTSRGTLTCDGQFDCLVLLGMSDTRFIVFDAPDTTSFDADLNIIRNARIYMYVLFFGIFSLSVGVLLTFVVVRCYRRQENRERSNSRVFIVSQDNNGSQEGQMRGFAGDSIRSQMDPPPYSAAPPSYEEAVAPKV